MDAILSKRRWVKANIPYLSYSVQRNLLQVWKWERFTNTKPILSCSENTCFHFFICAYAGLTHMSQHGVICNHPFLVYEWRNKGCWYTAMKTIRITIHYPFTNPDNPYTSRDFISYYQLWLCYFRDCRAIIQFTRHNFRRNDFMTMPLRQRTGIPEIIMQQFETSIHINHSMLLRAIHYAIPLLTRCLLTMEYLINGLRMAWSSYNAVYFPS